MTIPEQPPELPSPAPSKTALLLQFLKHHDAFCPLCQYNLRNLVVPRCPECGREIELTVGLTEPFMMPWVLTTIFVAMAASIGVIFLFASAVHGPPPLHDFPAWPCISLAYALAAIPLTFVLIGARRKFMKLPPAAQSSFAIAAFGIDAFLLVATIVFTR